MNINGAEPPSKKPLEQYMSESYNIILKNPIIIIPQFLTTLIATIGNSFSIIPEGAPISLIFFINTIFSPLYTNLYLFAIKKEKISLKESLRKYHYRFKELFSSQIIILLFGTILLTPLTFTNNIISSYYDISNYIFILLILYVLILNLLYSYLDLLILIIIVDYCNITSALKTAIVFYKERFWMILGLVITITIIESIVLDFIGLQLFRFIFDVFYSITILAIFLNYRKLNPTSLTNVPESSSVISLQRSKKKLSRIDKKNKRNLKIIAWCCMVFGLLLFGIYRFTNTLWPLTICIPLLVIAQILFAIQYFIKA